MAFMLKIRLQRIGRKNDPSFRVVVTDSRRGVGSARYVEIVGTHNPKQHTTVLKAERILYWLGKGAQASGTVHNMLITHKVIEGKKINVLPKKRPIVKEEEKEKEAEAAAPAPSAGGAAPAPVADASAPSEEEATAAPQTTEPAA